MNENSALSRINARPGRRGHRHGPIPPIRAIHDFQVRIERLMEDRTILPQWSARRRFDLFCFLHTWTENSYKHGLRNFHETDILKGLCTDFCRWRRGALTLPDLVAGLAALPVVLARGEPGNRILRLAIGDPPATPDTSPDASPNGRPAATPDGDPS